MSEERYISMDEEHLRKMFKEVKSNDLSRREFERNKTERIKALSNAISSTFKEQSISIHDQQRERGQLMERLNEICFQQYDSSEPI